MSNLAELPLSDGFDWFCVIAKMAFATPLAQGLPNRLALHDWNCVKF